MWHIESVEIPGNAGGVASLSLDNNSLPHISCYNFTNHDLYYAYRDGAGWHVQIVDNNGDVGTFSSLALDRFNMPHISYYDATALDLKYAVGTGLAWLDVTVSTTGATLQLAWEELPGASEYWIYGASNAPFFIPGLAPDYAFRLVILPQGTSVWSSPAGIGDPLDNRTYLVVAVNEVETELARSDRVGEHDFGLELP